MTEKDKEIQELRIEVDRLKKELKKKEENARALTFLLWPNRVFYDNPEDEIARLRACLSLIMDITARAAE